jgi:hypothetical protein
MKDITHRGYSQEGKIFIESGGSWKEGIPYTYWKEYSSKYFRDIEFIRFEFGGREEVLSKTDF